MPTFAFPAEMYPGLASTQSYEEDAPSLVPNQPKPQKGLPIAPIGESPEELALKEDRLALGTNLSRGLQGGVQQTQAMLYGAAGLAGNALGLEGLEQWGREGQQRNLQEAAAFAPAAGESGASFSDADSFADYANWAARTFGEQVPNLVTMFAGAGVGGALGKAALGGLAAKSAMGLADTAVTGGAAKLAAKEFLAKGAAVRLPTEAAQKAAEGYLRAGTAGQLAGGIAASTAMEGGGMYGDQVEEGLEPRASQIALPAAAAGALDFLVPGGLITRQYGKAAAGALPAIGRTLGAMGAEAGTETTQGIIERATLEDAKGTLGTPEGQARVFDKRAMVEEAAAGALLGGGFGLAREGGEALARRRDARIAALEEEERRAAEAAVPEDPAVIEARRQAILAEREAARQARTAAVAKATDIPEFDATLVPGRTLYAGTPDAETGLSPVMRSAAQMERLAQEKAQTAGQAFEDGLRLQREDAVARAREMVRLAQEKALARRAAQAKLEPAAPAAEAAPAEAAPALLYSQQQEAAEPQPFDQAKERARLAQVLGGERQLQELENSGLFELIDETEAAQRGWKPNRQAVFDEETGRSTIKYGPNMAGVTLHEAGMHAGDEILLHTAQPWLGAQFARQARKGDAAAQEALAQANDGIYGNAARGIDGWVKRVTESRGEAPAEQEVAQKLNKEVSAYFVERATLREGEKATGLLGRILGQVKAGWMASDAGQRLLRRGISPRIDDVTALEIAKRAVQAGKERGELVAAWRERNPEEPPTGPQGPAGPQGPGRKAEPGAVSFGKLGLASERGSAPRAEQAPLESLEQLRSSERFKTPEFTQWFEGAALKDEQGRPRILVHGTRNELEGKNLRPGQGLINTRLGVHLAYEPEMADAFSIGPYANVEQPYWSEARNQKAYLRREGKWGPDWVEPGGRSMPLVSNVRNIYKVPQKELRPGLFATDQTAIGADASAVAARRRPELFMQYAQRQRGATPERAQAAYKAMAAGQMLPKEDFEFGLSPERVQQADGDVLRAFFSTYGPMEFGKFEGRDVADVVAEEYRKELMAKGYDAVEYRNTSSNETVRGQEGEPALIVLDPERNLKSATGNKGGWRKDSGDMLESLRSDTLEAKPEFKSWSKGLPVVRGRGDYKGGPAVFDTYHGTTHTGIERFKERGMPDGWLGRGPYFTTQPEDAAANYAGTGPDLAMRIGREADRVGESVLMDGGYAEDVLRRYYENAPGLGDAERESLLERLDDGDVEGLLEEDGEAAIQAEAEAAVKGDSEGLTMPSYVRLERPADITPDTATVLDYETVEDEEGNVLEEKGAAMDFLAAVERVGQSYDIDDRTVEETRRQLWESAALEGGLSLREAFDIVKSSGMADYAVDESTDEMIGGGQIFKEIAQEAGFDGIVMDAGEAFGPGRAGPFGVRMPGMAGVTRDTLHVVPFEPDRKANVKSAVGSGFSLREGSDILESLAPSERAGLEQGRVDRLLRELAYPTQSTKSMGLIGYVDPAEFLRATVPDQEAADRITKEAGELDVQRLRDETQTPFLDFDEEGVKGHEGRHRMAALARRGVKQVPIVLRNYGGKRYDADAGDLQLSGQEFGKWGTGAPLTVKGAIPVSYANADRIDRIFGAKQAESPELLFSERQTKTPEFQRWYKGAALRTEAGEPVRLYHGTKRDFTAFKPKYPDGLTFLSTNPHFASKWAVGSGPEGSLRGNSEENRVEAERIREIENEVGKQFSWKYDESDPNWMAQFEADRARMKEEVRKRTGFSSWVEYEQYAGTRTMPLYSNVKKVFDPTKDWKELEPFVREQLGDDVVRRGYHKQGNWLVYENKAVVEELKKRGYDAMWLAEDSGGPLETLAVFNPENIKSATGNRGTWDESAEVLESFLGPLSATADKKMLALAEKWEAQGVSPRLILRETGWGRNPVDGAWRYEVSDEDVRWKPDWKKVPEGRGAKLKLGDVLEAPKLYRAYPELADLPFAKVGAFFDFLGKQQGWLTDKAEDGTQQLVVTPYAQDPVGVALHEMQHWVQGKEGWGRGGSPESVRLNDRDALEKAAMLRSVLLTDGAPDPVPAEQFEKVKEQLPELDRLYGTLDKTQMELRDVRRLKNMLRSTGLAEIAQVEAEEKAQAEAEYKTAEEEYERQVAAWKEERNRLYEENRAQQQQRIDEYFEKMKAARGTAEEARVRAEKPEWTPAPEPAFPHPSWPDRRYTSRYTAGSRANELMKQLQEAEKATEQKEREHSAMEQLVQKELKQRTSGLDALRFLMYQQLSGEAEARNTDGRQKLTMAERRQFPPERTLDVPYALQTLRKGEGEGEGDGEALESLVWHAGPNSWQPEPGFPRGRPRLDKVGTGEGGQMFGWGWYSAENPEVSGPEGTYAKAFTRQKQRGPVVLIGTDGSRLNVSALPSVWDKRQAKFEQDLPYGTYMLRARTIATALKMGTPVKEIKDRFDEAVKRVDEQIRFAQNALKDAYTQREIDEWTDELAWLTRVKEQYVPSTGAFVADLVQKQYKQDITAFVTRNDIPDEVMGRMLQWDKPLNEQTPEVRAALTALENEVENPKTALTRRADLQAFFEDEGYLRNRNTGEALYKLLADALPSVPGEHSKKKVSEYLRSLGIVGNKYLDQGSRGSDGGATYNYVIWDQDVLDEVGRRHADHKTGELLESVAPGPQTFPSDFAARNKALRESDPTAVQRARNMLYRAVAPGGLIRAKAPGGFPVVLQRNARQTMVDRQGEITVNLLERAVQADYGRSWRKLDDRQKAGINAALGGDNEGLKRLPRGVQEVVIGMRQQLDAFSREYVQELLTQIEDLGRSGQALGEREQKDIAAKQALISTLAGNVGRYLHRSYKMFDDSKWFQHVGEDVYNRARGWLMAENALTADQADKWMEAFLKNGTAYDSLEDYVREGKIGETDKRVLLRRGEIPQPLLDLMGEYTDPRVNYVKTLTKTSRLVLNTKFQREFRRIGLANKWLFEKDDLDRPTTGIAKEIPGGKGYEHLAGLYTYPEVVKGLRDILQRNSAEPWLRKAQEIIALAKWSKTIGSPLPTGLRNFLANVMALIANADMSVEGLRNAVLSAEEYLADPSKVDDKLRAKRAHLALLGVSLDTPYAGEMMELGRLAGIESALDVKGTEVGKKWEGLRRVGRETKGWLERAYQYGDDFYKIIAFESQYKQLARALLGDARRKYAGEAKGTETRWEIGSGPIELREQHDGRWSYVDAFGFNVREGRESWATEQEARAKVADVLARWEVENLAAERVRNTYMTYSMVGNLPKWLARFPLVGTFVSFPVESIRTMANQLNYARKDWADPRMRRMAARRTLGLIAAASVPGIVGTVGMSLVGADEEEMEGARQAMAEWNKLSNLAAVGRTEDGTLEVMDLGYFDLYRLWRLPFNAARNPDPLGEDIYNVAKELALPFLGLDITTEAVVEVLQNRSMTGGPIWEATDPPLEQSWKIAKHLLEPFTSSTLLQLNKLLDAANGKVMRDGREMDALTEFGALFGFKTTEARPRSMLFYHNFEFQLRRGMAEYGLRRMVSDPNAVEAGGLDAEVERAWAKRREAYERLGRKVRAAQELGMSRLAIRLELKQLGVAQKDLGALMRGEVPVWAPTASTLLGPVKSGEALGMGAEHRRTVQERRRQALRKIRELDRQAR